MPCHGVLLFFQLSFCYTHKISDEQQQSSWMLLRYCTLPLINTILPTTSKHITLCLPTYNAVRPFRKYNVGSLCFFSIKHAGISKGYYLLSDAEFGSRALLISPAITPGKKSMCMEFMYHMYGNDVTTLNVLVENEEGIRLPAWSRFGNHNDKWMRGFFKIGTANFLVVFEAFGSRWLRRQIAIDAITIDECINFGKLWLRDSSFVNLFKYILRYNALMIFEHIQFSGPWVMLKLV